MPVVDLYYPAPTGRSNPTSSPRKDQNIFTVEFSSSSSSGLSSTNSTPVEKATRGKHTRRTNADLFDDGSNADIDSSSPVSGDWGATSQYIAPAGTAASIGKGANADSDLSSQRKSQRSSLSPEQSSLSPEQLRAVRRKIKRHQRKLNAAKQAAAASTSNDGSGDLGSTSPSWKPAFVEASIDEPAFKTAGFDMDRIRAAAEDNTAPNGGLNKEDVKKILRANDESTDGSSSECRSRLAGILPAHR